MTAATATNFNAGQISAGREIQLWGNVPAPAAGAIAALHTDGTPDSLTIPTALPLGMTDKGATLTAKGSYQDFNADEFSGAVKTVFTALEMSIQTGLMQVENMDILALLSSGYGTVASLTGGKKLSFGIGTQLYSGILGVWKLEADPTKFCMFHIYRAINKNGFEINKSRNEKSVNSTNFMGFDVPGRAVGDTMGYIYIPTVS